MGNRANFVVVKSQDWRLYYSHWAGGRILDGLIGGPAFALRYAQTLRPCPKDQWVDPVWADGGAVVDLDRSRLLFFGDELMVAMAERRALMGVLAAVWPGYGIGWAYDGTIELAGYVGAELPTHTWDKQPTLRLARDRKHVVPSCFCRRRRGTTSDVASVVVPQPGVARACIGGQAARPRCAKRNTGQDP